MKQIIAVVLVALCSCACQDFGRPYSHEDATFAVYNRSSDNMQFRVNGVDQERLIPAQGSANFQVEIQVAKSPAESGNFGPSQIDKRTQVSVAFRNPRTGSLSPVQYCDAGAKVVTTVTYTITDRGGELVNCQSTYTY